jgi:opacity protein-like surface antigen
MKNFTFAITLAFASLGAAQAQDMSNAQYGTPAVAPSAAPMQQAAPQKQMRAVVGAGITFGGDKLATAEYENGGSIDIRAGSMLTFFGGVDYRVTPAFSLQATIGYHVDNASASNGDIRFERMPIELLAYYHTADKWRVGAGARYVSNPKLKSSGAADIGDYSFDNTVGAVIEAEYMMTPKFGLKMRYVTEKYEIDGLAEKIDGSHVGLFANYYF